MKATLLVTINMEKISSRQRQHSAHIFGNFYVINNK